MIYDRHESEKKEKRNNDDNIYGVALIVKNLYNPPIPFACGTQNNRRRQIDSHTRNTSRDNGPSKG